MRAERAYERLPHASATPARGDFQSRAESTAFQAVVVQSTTGGVYWGCTAQRHVFESRTGFVLDSRPALAV
jgi:hypothetical protein